MALDLNALAAAAAQTGMADMTQAVKGGGSEPPAEGSGTAVFIGYIEIGKHKRKIQGVDKTVDEAILRFELTGPLWPAREVDGVKIPHIIDVKLTRSLNDKAKLFKLFTRMNYEGKATHITQLLTQTYKVTVRHREAKIGDKTMKFPELTDKEGNFTILPPRVEIFDEDTGAVTFKNMKVNPHITAFHALLWDKPDLDQWKSIFIEGKWPDEKNEDGSVKKEGKSKNKYQQLIASAVNFDGSQVQQLIIGNGIELDIPAPGEDFQEDGEDVATPATGAKQSAVDSVKGDDALSDIGA